MRVRRVFPTLHVMTIVLTLAACSEDSAQPLSLAQPARLADRCANGGYLGLATAVGAPFASEASCVSYAVAGHVFGTLPPTLVASVSHDAVNWIVHFAGSGLKPGAPAVVHVAVDGLASPGGRMTVFAGRSD